MKLHNTIIYLLGIPAVGKYTVAKEIARLTGAKLLDSQVINYPIYYVVGYDGTDSFPFPRGASQHIETIHKAVLAVVRDHCPPDASFVLTNVLDANDPGDRAWFRRIERVAKHRKAVFVPVWLTCDAETIRQRKTAPERKARLKDIDVTSIPRWLNEFQVLKVEHPNALTLNTANTTPHAIATQILKHVNAIDGKTLPASAVL